MTTARKAKLSITLDADLLATIDREAKRLDVTRSGLMERWLRRGARGGEAQRLEEETATYYTSMTARERSEDTAIALATGRAAKRVVVDGSSAPGDRRPKRGW
jgi:metal-responsive CopG/Arc/MetJ family transcriptional regulator